jgi:hypothetical protein
VNIKCCPPKGDKMTQINETTLPELIGSEKQVAWAEKLRVKAIAELKQDIARKQAMVDSREGDMKERWERMLATSVQLLNDLISETSASKIIDGWK